MKQKKYKLETGLDADREYLLICLDCGNTNRFTRTVYGEAKFTEQETYNAIADDVDYMNDREYDDEDITDEDDWACRYCKNGGDIKECQDQDEIYMTILEHVNSKGFWSKKYLKTPNKKIQEKIGLIQMVDEL